MNIQQRIIEQGIFSPIAKIGMYEVVGLGLAAAAPKVINAGERAYNEVKDRIETEQAIKAEGIQAKSYAEAKMKLDSIRFDRVCDELGVPVPQKPASDASEQEQLDYQFKVLDIYQKENIKNFNEIATILEPINESL